MADDSLTPEKLVIDLRVHARSVSMTAETCMLLLAAADMIEYGTPVIRLPCGCTEATDGRTKWLCEEHSNG